jgi:Kef-type K+ transport system membrane component KefB
MALLARIIVILFGFFAASFAAAAVVIGAVLFPEWSEIDLGLDDSTLSIIATFGFIFISGFALLPAVIVALITEAFGIRSLLLYVVGGAIAGAACYLSLVPFDTDTMSFHGIVHRELEVMTGAGIVAGFVYWLIAGRNAGAWRGLPQSSSTPPAAR